MKRRNFFSNLIVLFVGLFGLFGTSKAKPSTDPYYECCGNCKSWHEWDYDLVIQSDLPGIPLRIGGCGCEPAAALRIKEATRINEVLPPIDDSTWNSSDACFHYRNAWRPEYRRRI